MDGIKGGNGKDPWVILDLSLTAVIRIRIEIEIEIDIFTSRVEGRGSRHEVLIGFNPGGHGNEDGKTLDGGLTRLINAIIRYPSCHCPPGPHA